MKKNFFQAKRETRFSKGFLFQAKRETRFLSQARFFLFLILIGFLVLPALSALALGFPPVSGVITEEVPRDMDVLKTFERITNYLFTILLIVAAMYLVMAAFSFITASGDATKIETARKWVLMALVGVAVAIMARGLVSLVRMMVGT